MLVPEAEQTGNVSWTSFATTPEKAERVFRNITSSSASTATPTYTAYHLSVLWLHHMQSEAKNAGYEWIAPHATHDDVEDEYVFEWWRGERKLTVYITIFNIQIIKVWGSSIDTEMQVVIDPSRRLTLAAWAWLLTGSAL